MNVTVMSKGKEIMTALTVLGKVPHPPEVQQKTEDSAKPVHKDKRDEGSVEVDYNSDSTDEEGQSALRNGQLAMEQPALRDPLSCEHLALRIEPATALVQEPSSHHEKRSADDTSGSELSILTSNLIMRESPNVGTLAAEIAKPVLNAKSIMEIAEKKDIMVTLAGTAQYPWAISR